MGLVEMAEKDLKKVEERGSGEGIETVNDY